MKTTGLACPTAVTSPTLVLVWGQEGYSIMAQITQRRLEASSLTKIQCILAAKSASADLTALLTLIASWVDKNRASHSDIITGVVHFASYKLSAAVARSADGAGGHLCLFNSCQSWRS